MWNGSGTFVGFFASKRLTLTLYYDPLPDTFLSFLLLAVYRANMEFRLGVGAGVGVRHILCLKVLALYRQGPSSF